MKKIFTRLIACLLLVAILCGCEAIVPPLPDNGNPGNSQSGNENENNNNNSNNSNNAGNNGGGSGGGESDVDMQGFLYELNDARDGYLVTRLSSGASTAKEIRIPAVHKGKPVVGIKKDTFRDCTELESVTIPSTVREIGENAFYGCYALAAIVFLGSMAEWLSMDRYHYVNIELLIRCGNGEMLEEEGVILGGGTTGGGTTGGGDEEEGDPNGRFTVTFKYINTAGEEIEDLEGYTESLQRNIRYGNNAHDIKTEDVTLFDNYVIIGWNRDMLQAMAGTIDENALTNIKSDRTVYSVVRAKVKKTVTFIAANGASLGTREYLEGSALDKGAPRPTVPGQYFKKWEFFSNNEAGKTDSSQYCIYGDCTFKAVMGATDGTIGMTSTPILLDGKKDQAYTTSNAYLALNNQKQVDDAKTVDMVDGFRADASCVKADTWMVWDGSYIYLLIEVYDTTLTFRSEAYTKGGVDAWCNDAVEIWYTFEQDATITKNETRVGLGASGDRTHPGDGKYALPRSEYKGTPTGIGGGRSTHFEEIKYAVRNYIMLENEGGDTSGLDANGVEAPSYVIEFKIPAKTEGQADPAYAYKDWSGAKEEKLTGDDLEKYNMTGLLYGNDPTSNNISNYRFTDGEDLMVGDYVRFSLQINDLRLTLEELAGGTYFDSYTLPELQYIDPSYTKYDYDRNQIKLWTFDGSKVVAASTRGKFAAAGATQRKVADYLMFSLGGDAEGSYNVAGFQKDLADYRKNVMLDKYGHVYIRPDVVE